MLLFLLLLSLVCHCVSSSSSSSPDFLSSSDLAVLRELRDGIAEEVGGFERGFGQPSSLIVTFVSGTRAVCKNGRHAYYKMDQLVNEVFVFYLDRALHMGHVLPATISEFSRRRFKNVMDRKIVQDFWRVGDPMVCSLFLDDLPKARLPPHFSKQLYQLSVPSGERKGWSDSEKRLTEMWGGVVAVDFLTGNTERLSQSLAHESMQPKAKRKTQGISLAACRHADCHVENTLWDEAGKKLWLVDNNSGMFYDKMGSLAEPISWILEDVCVFPASLVRELEAKKNDSELRGLVSMLVNRFEPEGPVQNGLRVKFFHVRFTSLMDHIRKCRQLNEGSVSFFK